MDPLGPLAIVGIIACGAAGEIFTNKVHKACKKRKQRKQQKQFQNDVFNNANNDNIVYDNYYNNMKQHIINTVSVATILDLATQVTCNGEQWRSPFA